MTQILFQELMRTRLAAMLLALGALVTSGDASALEFSDLSEGYSNCTYQDNNNGTSTFGVTIRYKSTKGHLGKLSGRFYSRAILIYTYDKTGALRMSMLSAKRVYMEGNPHTSVFANGRYAMYIGLAQAGGRGSWLVEDAQTVRVTMILENSKFADWPAIGVQAGNYIFNKGGPSHDILEITGLAYIGKTNLTGICNVIVDPELPLPLEAKISMNAPDWDLGELRQGEEARRPFNDPLKHLCFTYDGPQWTGLRYVINATNQNGLSGDGSYQLKLAASPSDAVPYRLSLQGTGMAIDLPNTSNVVATIDKSGRECFTPTFTAVPAKTAREGHYSDVLSFTVTASP